MVLTPLATGVLIGLAVGIVLACLVLAGAYRAAGGGLPVHEDEPAGAPVTVTFAGPDDYSVWQRDNGRTQMLSLDELRRLHAEHAAADHLPL